MTSQELFEHVQQLARDLGVRLWVCMTCERGRWGVDGEAVEQGDDRWITISELPDTPEAYLVALHELGHHADPCWGKGLRLDREAFAWRYARVASRIPMTPDLWRMIANKLATYGIDRRFKRTEAFDSLLTEAVSHS